MSNAADKRLAMQDPRTQYPQPPFEPQPQEAPGLAEAMNPTPDHGETSYRGHGRLEGASPSRTTGWNGRPSDLNAAGREHRIDRFVLSALCHGRRGRLAERRSKSV